MFCGGVSSQKTPPPPPSGALLPDSVVFARNGRVALNVVLCVNDDVLFSSTLIKMTINRAPPSQHCALHLAGNARRRIAEIMDRKGQGRSDGRKCMVLEFNIVIIEFNNFER